MNEGENLRVRQCIAHVSSLHLLLSWLKHDRCRLAATRSLFFQAQEVPPHLYSMFDLRPTDLSLPVSSLFFFFFFSRFFLEIIDVYITSGKSPVASTVVYNFYPTGKIIKFKVLTVRLLLEISQNEDQFNFSKGKKELRIIELRIESVTSGNN